MNNEGHGVMVLSGKVKILWLADGKRNERVFDSHEESKPFTNELNEKGVLWVLTDKFEY
jgi:hypothetical protein